MSPDHSVPIVDCSSLACGRADPNAVGAIDRACRDSGFFYIADHGLESLFEPVWKATRWFFRLPLADKQAVARSETNSRGFYNQELTKNARDMKQVFDFGQLPNPKLPDNDRANHTQDGWNQWSGAAGGDEFKSVLTEYFDACGSVALRLLEVLTVNLGALEGELARDFYPRHSSFLRLNYYPVEDPCPETGADQALAADSGHMGVHHHTDAGALTLLLQDGVGGLEIFHRQRWVPVKPIPGTLVVNIGDIVQVWSNDHYRAPLHRVMASTRRDRYSLPFFFNPIYRANYAPLTHQLSEEKPARYSEINWGHFRLERQHGDYGDYGDEIQISDFRIS